MNGYESLCSFWVCMNMRVCVCLRGDGGRLFIMEKKRSSAPVSLSIRESERERERNRSTDRQEEIIVREINFSQSKMYEKMN